jgi:hypothetical protein
MHVCLGWPWLGKLLIFSGVISILMGANNKLNFPLLSTNNIDARRNGHAIVKIEINFYVLYFMYVKCHIIWTGLR